MFNVSMRVRKIIAGICLLIMALYGADKFTTFSFFNISDVFHWKLLLVPVMIGLMFMPTPEMISEYNRKKEEKKRSQSNDIE